MKYVVGVADMRIASGQDDTIVTHALGSCLGVSIYDPQTRVGGIFHVMLPNASVSPEKAQKNPLMFVDTGTPVFFKEAYTAGASKGRLVVKVAGGASLGGREDFFAIGKRNMVVLRKLFWKNGIMIAAQDVGGHISRTVHLDMDTGRTWLSSNGKKWEL